MTTLGAHAICKNEINHIADWYENISSLCDEVVIVDTGSTDGTLEWLKEKSAIDSKCKLFEFVWIKDFSAARNFALSKVESDYALFVDLDDRILEVNEFLKWKKTVMSSANFWFAVYKYAENCEFARERVFKNKIDLTWREFIHEGVSPNVKDKHLDVHYATTWKVTHLRTAEDLKKDRSRNIEIIEHHKSKGAVLSSRMTYYYGKELFESDNPLDAYPILLEAAGRSDLELHDRILAIQYASLSAMRLNQFEKAIALAHQGMQISPHRAEFHVIAGDGYLKLNRIKDSIPHYYAAKHCMDPESNGQMRGAIFSHKDSYNKYPTMQLVRVFFNMGDMVRAQQELEALSLEFAMDKEVQALSLEFSNIKKITNIPKIGEAPKSDDIVISCAPGGLYEWDETLLAERGMGGSEIAAIKLARSLHEQTGRTVRIFNTRKNNVQLNGVMYQSTNELNSWLSENIPSLHIAWRHNIKVTNAPTILWCHDLWCHGIDNIANYDKLAVLSPFHKEYIQGLFNIPDEKIFLTRNGINNFDKFKSIEKKVCKILWPSSPDRGLQHAIATLDLVIEKGHEVELHVFYGVDNLITMGKGEEAQFFLDLMNKRPWIVNHGLTIGHKLPAMYSDACLWLYPTNFQETFCCVALEMVLSGVYPIYRNYGALPDTLGEFTTLGMAEGHDVSPENYAFWAQRVIEAIKEKKWEKVKADNASHFSWDVVAREWIAESTL